MTTSTSIRHCTACAAPIPAGALYCARCGADAPTEVGAETPAEGSSDLAALEARKASLQNALGANFNVQRLVGKGGFGEVWAAFDLELARAVAIKVLRTELVTTPGFRERFRHEARAVAKMRHPGIVPIYHVGEAQGLVYFIMPLVEGLTLKNALDQGPVAPDEIVRILVEASAALREAHRRGIVHRDLKPENVMLEGPDRRVLLMDFGIAQSEDIQDKELTGAGMVLGSPEYMSPEQATGKRQLDGRSDIYSLGVMAYRMVAGRLPFDAETARELLIKHVTTPPEPLENVPGPLSYAIMRCLAKAPDDRWQTTDEFVAALTGNTAMTAAVRAPSADAWPPVVTPRQATGGRNTLGLVLAVAGLLVGALAVREALTARGSRRSVSVSDAIVVTYQGARDSLQLLTASFMGAGLSAAKFLPAQESILNGAEQTIEQTHGSIDDLLLDLGEGNRREAEEAMNNLWLAGLYAVRLAPRPSESARCAFQPLDRGVRLRDGDPQGNCWYSLTPAPAAVALPVEYFVQFRLTDVERRGAGVGMAWCAGAATCRVAFLWPGSRIEWASLRTGAGLRSLNLGDQLPRLDDWHMLRVRYQSERLRVWIDSTQVLHVSEPEAAGFFERPGDLRLVVQNAAAEIRSDGVGVVGVRRP